MNHRRHFLKTSLAGTAGLITLPNIFGGSLFAATTPNKRLQVAQIGCGRMGLADMGRVLLEQGARVVAVCDLDAKRSAEAQKRVEDFHQPSAAPARRSKTAASANSRPSKSASAWINPAANGRRR